MKKNLYICTIEVMSREIVRDEAQLRKLCAGYPTYLIILIIPNLMRFL